MNDSKKSKKNLIVSCPTCNKKVTWENQQPYKPFCSERCKLIDLGEWAADERAIPGDPTDSGLDADPYLH